MLNVTPLTAADLASLLQQGSASSMTLIGDRAVLTPANELFTDA